MAAQLLREQARIWVQEPYSVASQRAALLAMDVEGLRLRKKLKTAQQAVTDAKKKVRVLWWWWLVPWL